MDTTRLTSPVNPIVSNNDGSGDGAAPVPGPPVAPDLIAAAVGANQRGAPTDLGGRVDRVEQDVNTLLSWIAGPIPEGETIGLTRIAMLEGRLEALAAFVRDAAPIV